MSPRRPRGTRNEPRPGRPVQEALRRAAYVSETRRARPARPRPDEGFAMSSPVALMSAAAVALAGLGFVLTGHSASADHAQLAAAPPTSTSTSTSVERPVKMHARHHAPVVHRDQVYVSVYNNSSITGLAGATAQRIGALGWKVVGSDNWYGTIPATTIYYPSGMERAGRLLAQDLGVQRVMPSVAPMSTDRLTVILTADFG